MKIICGNCRKILRRETELKRVFPDIPDLLERISPGEPVPIGECPDCGALVHAVAEPPTRHCRICNEAVEEPELREHLCLHHPGAKQMSWEEVCDQFRLQGDAPAPPDDGEETRIELVRLPAMQFKPPNSGKNARRKVVISVTGGVATAEAWPADVEVEIRDYDTEGCDPKDLEADGCRVSRYRTEP